MIYPGTNGQKFSAEKNLILNWVLSLLLGSVIKISISFLSPCLIVLSLIYESSSTKSRMLFFLAALFYSCIFLFTYGVFIQKWHKQGIKIGLWLTFTLRELQKVTAYELSAVDNHWVRTFYSIGVTIMTSGLNTKLHRRKYEILFLLVWVALATDIVWFANNSEVYYQFLSHRIYMSEVDNTLRSCSQIIK